MLQSNNLIMLCTILTGVVVVGILFIRRALKHRKGLNEISIDASEVETEDIDSEAFDTYFSMKNTKKNFYLLRFICRIGIPIEKPKYVKISRNYHQLIRKITQVIGKNDLSVATYVDNVLKAHFEEHKDSIVMLFNQSAENDFEKEE